MKNFIIIKGEKTFVKSNSTILKNPSIEKRKEIIKNEKIKFMPNSFKI